MSRRKYKRNGGHPPELSNAQHPPPGQSCSREVGHHLEMMKKIQKMRNDDKLVDIVIKVGENRFPSHKFVLGAASDVFLSMFGKLTWTEGSSKEIEFYEEDHSALVFPEFLDYIYCVKITLTAENVIPLHTLAHKYQIISLMRKSREFMFRNIERPSGQNAVVLYHQCAQTYGYKTLEERCFSFMLFNLAIVVESPYWTAMSKTNLKELIENDNLVVESELAVFRAVQYWLISQENLSIDEAALRITTEELLPFFRFHFMSPEELMQMERQHLVNIFPDLFTVPVLRGYRFQFMRKKDRQNSVGTVFMTQHKTVPRIYCKIEDLEPIHEENWDLTVQSRSSWSAADSEKSVWFCSVDLVRRISHISEYTLTFNALKCGIIRGTYKIVIIHRYEHGGQFFQKVSTSDIVDSEGCFDVDYSVRLPPRVNFSNDVKVGVLIMPMA